MFRNAAMTVLLLAVAALAAGCKPSVPASDASASGDANVETASQAPEATASESLPVAADAPASKPAVVLPPEACTLQGNREFFQQFVASADVRRAYSKLDLKAGIAAADVAAHPQFDGFRIGLVDNRWVLVDPATGVANYPRVELKHSLQGNTYTVDYTKARFSNGDETVEPYGETAGYIFEFINGCWMLVSQTAAY